MRATKRAPVKFPDSVPPSRNPLTGVLCLLFHISEWRLLFPSYLSPLFFFQLAEACRGKSDYGAGGSERNTIFTQQERTSLPWPPPQPWMGFFRRPGRGSIEKWRHGARQISELKWHRWWHLSWWWWICIWEGGGGGGGILCPVVPLNRFERRTNTSPSITANDKTGWMERRRTANAYRQAPRITRPPGNVFKAGGRWRWLHFAGWWVYNTPTHPHHMCAPDSHTCTL